MYLCAASESELCGSTAVKQQKEDRRRRAPSGSGPSLPLHPHLYNNNNILLYERRQ